ncbi:MAG: sigma 54-interacting transcriptional regulator [Flavobacteriaceae bacterium]|tara:strand:+ start:3143 stop:4426 length:1284 start_codon:yes stop_codon:yes gene_type:complete
MDNIQTIKQRFGIIGIDDSLNRALEKALRVASTNISVLVTGESGVGKENIPKIIHQYSNRKHSKYIAVNCGAIPEGTIDSELFGHEKGAFTGATSTRSGYFEVADGGTIFLDEVGELPLPTQVRLLRILENGEFLKVGSSKVQKTDVRIVAATNLQMIDAIQKGKFREDLYYRLSTIEINLPPLRERKDDIPLLFRKFASDFGLKYRMPPLSLDETAKTALTKYNWNGNIRQLRNVAEQISVLEKERKLDSEIIKNYLPDFDHQLPALIKKTNTDNNFSSEREILYKVLFDMKNDINDLKKLTLEILNESSTELVQKKNKNLIDKIYQNENDVSKNLNNSNEAISFEKTSNQSEVLNTSSNNSEFDYADSVIEEEPLSLLEKEIEMIKSALERAKGKRKVASQELGISERTLYRKIKQFNLNVDDED